jgi:hypothetical protein
VHAARTVTITTIAHLIPEKRMRGLGRSRKRDDPPQRPPYGLHRLTKNQATPATRATPRKKARVPGFSMPSAYAA